jgi:hypothetical protein
MGIPDVLKTLGKTEADIKSFGFRYKINIEPGFEILTDKKAIRIIQITADFKDLKGKTIDFFKFQNKDEVRNFLEQNLGTPSKTKGLVDFVSKNDCEFIYENGITYHYMLKNEKPASIIEIVPVEKPIQLKKDNEPKTMGISALASLYSDFPDLVKKGLGITSKDLKVLGINVNMTTSEILKKLDKAEIDLDKDLTLKPVPGFEIFTTNKQTVERIIIRKDFKGLKGLSIDFFKLKTKNDALEFLREHIGEPIKIEDRNISELVLSTEFIYPNGITYTYTLFVGSTEPSNIIQVLPASNVDEAKIKTVLSKKTLPTKKSMDEKYDFRKTTWGQTKKEVEQTETLIPIHSDDKVIMYKETLLGFPTIVGYVFNQNRLVRGAYSFSQSHTNKNDYISDFEKIKFTLSKKYGFPQSDIKNWKNSLYKNDPEQFGLAISIGHLEYVSKWETERTLIFLVLKGDNYKITFQLFYDSKNIEIKEQDESDKF